MQPSSTIMKIPHFPILRATVVLCVALLLIPTAHAGFIDLLKGEPEQAAFQRVAFYGSALVKKVDGKVDRLAGIDRWEPLAPGMKLHAGDMVRTTQGTAILQIVESQSFVRMTPQTILRLAPPVPEVDPSTIAGHNDRKGYAVRGCRGMAFSRADGESWKPIVVNTVLESDCVVKIESGALIDLFHTETLRPLRIQGPAEVLLPDPVASIAMVKRQFASDGGR